MLDRSLVEQFHRVIDNYQMDDRKINQLAFPLLAKHPQLVNVRLSDVRDDRDSDSDYTPLHKAAGHLNLDLIRRMIALGADVNASTRCEIVPLGKAITVGLSTSDAYQQTKLKAVEILLEAGADPNHRMEPISTSPRRPDRLPCCYRTVTTYPLC
jgi:ankyrin repeat protein